MIPPPLPKVGVAAGPFAGQYFDTPAPRRRAAEAEPASAAFGGVIVAICALFVWFVYGFASEFGNLHGLAASGIAMGILSALMDRDMCDAAWTFCQWATRGWIGVATQLQADLAHED